MNDNATITQEPLKVDMYRLGDLIHVHLGFIHPEHNEHWQISSGEDSPGGHYAFERALNSIYTTHSLETISLGKVLPEIFQDEKWEDTTILEAGTLLDTFANYLSKKGWHDVGEKTEDERYDVSLRPLDQLVFSGGVGHYIPLPDDDVLDERPLLFQEAIPEYVEKRFGEIKLGHAVRDETYIAANVDGKYLETREAMHQNWNYMREAEAALETFKIELEDRRT
ncbi:hypothetical protein HN789_03015 [archaeon]|jgi:hypothetical protein|nr:hypothetical protein [archaeon]MBT4023225.1 hypothetical protein [archaeon]MBT4271895.1 hypothetical protein [archaeon]MBT4460994.1 hypothetical protein [archaeon]MBT4858430.1 hypothetical protein [archaeon]